MSKLRDLGERRLIDEVIRKHCSFAGDDCALLDLPGSRLAITTDPVPEPAALVIAGDPDLYWKGWLLVTINASDLAAAGATPLGFVAAVEAPPEASVEDLDRLLQGIADACAAEGIQYAGGNLKEAGSFSATGTAVGSVPSARGLSRSGAQVGDLIFSIGKGGEFWRDALYVQAGLSVDTQVSRLFRPLSQLRVLAELARSGHIKAAIDNSDGLLASLEQLATANNAGIKIDLGQLTVSNWEKTGADNPARLWLGWGDWNVLVAIDRGGSQSILDVAGDLGADIVQIGEVVEKSGVMLTRGDASQAAPRLESERFSSDSWFTAGISSYVKLLLSCPIP